MADFFHVFAVILRILAIIASIVIIIITLLIIVFTIIGWPPIKSDNGWSFVCKKNF